MQLQHHNMQTPSLVDLAATAVDAAPVVFGYQIGNQHFIVDNHLQSELLIKPTLYPLPRSPAWLCGVLNLRGNILAVIDLSHSLSTSCTSIPGDFVLVIDKGPQAVAILIDGHPHALVDPQPLTVTSLTQVSHAAFIQGGVRANQTDWLQLNVQGLITHLKTQT